MACILQSAFAPPFLERSLWSKVMDFKQYRWSRSSHYHLHVTRFRFVAHSDRANEKRSRREVFRRSWKTRMLTTLRKERIIVFFCSRAHSATPRDGTLSTPPRNSDAAGATAGRRRQCPWTRDLVGAVCAISTRTHRTHSDKAVVNRRDTISFPVSLLC